MVAAQILTPGAVISGFSWKSTEVGPRELKNAIVSASSVAPTVSAVRAVPGLPIVK